MTNTVVVGPAEALAVRTVLGSGAVWLADDVVGGEPAGPGERSGGGGEAPDAHGPAASDAWFTCAVQVRAHGDPVPARARREAGGRVRVDVDGDLRGVAPGQSLVLYDGTRVLGQATVDGTERS